MMEQDEMLRRYLNDIGRYPRITAIREQELASIIQNNSDEVTCLKAKNELITSNLRMVVKMATSYYNRVGKLNGVNITVMDLIQAGNVGLINAASKYVPSRNTKFSTYAFPAIERKIKETVKQSRIIQIPVSSFYFIARIREMDDSDNGFSDEQIAKELDISIDTVRNLRMHQNPIVTDETGDLIERVSSKEIPLDEILNQRELREYLLNKIDELKPMEKWTIFHRYLSDSKMSLDQVGKKFGVSKERIRVAQLNGLRHLKDKIQEEKAIKKVKKENMYEK
jgi:RNA polymerase sigma factor (sigma-70 family)